MPAVVRGGRRQAPRPASDKPAAKSAPASSSRSSSTAKSAKGGRKPARYRAAMGALPLSPELTAWIAIAMIGLVVAGVMMSGVGTRVLGIFVSRIVDERIADMGISWQKVSYEGVSPQAARDIETAVNFRKGEAFALISLDQIRTDVEKVGWVKSATVRRKFPDQVIISVVEKPRLAVWQFRGRDAVIDDHGRVIPEARPGDFTGLPLVIGEGANDAAGPVIELLRARPALMQRTYYLERIDTRRWDIRLKDGGVIKLPALDQDQAMARLDNLMARNRLLDQRFSVIDLRDPESLVVSRAEPEA